MIDALSDDLNTPQMIAALHGLRNAAASGNQSDRGEFDRGAGVGRALLLFAEREAIRRGYRSIYLCTNVKMTENQAFYPKIGYVEYERKLDQGYDRIFYRKQLS